MWGSLRTAKVSEPRPPTTTTRTRTHDPVTRRRRRTLGASCLVAILSATSPVAAMPGPDGWMRVPRKRAKTPKKERFTPAMAAEEREQADRVARPLVDNGEHKAAAIAYDGAAARRGDPILYLRAADAYLEQAKNDRNPDMALAAMERASIALDALYFHLDDALDPDHRLIESSEIPGLIDQAKERRAAAAALVEEIEDERRQAALAAATPEPAPKKTTDPVRAATISGAILTSVGGVFLGVGVTGLGLGAARQREAEGPTVYGETYDDVATKGERANLLAYIGLPVGGVLLAAGIAALVVANKKKKARGESETAAIHLAPALGARSSGLSLSGRF
jgi:hypothetical protein